MEALKGVREEFVQRFRQPLHLVGMRVVQERNAHHAVLGIDAQRLDQSIGVEVPGPDTEAALAQ